MLALNHQISLRVLASVLVVLQLVSVQVDADRRENVKCLKGIERRLTGLEVPAEVGKLMKELDVGGKIDWVEHFRNYELGSWSKLIGERFTQVEASQLPVDCLLVNDLIRGINFQETPFNCVPQLDYSSCSIKIFNNFPKTFAIQKAAEICARASEQQFEPREREFSCIRQADLLLENGGFPLAIGVYVQSLRVDWHLPRDQVQQQIRATKHANFDEICGQTRETLNKLNQSLPCITRVNSNAPAAPLEPDARLNNFKWWQFLQRATMGCNVS